MKRITKEVWSKLPDGREITRWQITGKKLTVWLINFGATVQRMTYDDSDIILSLPTAEIYDRLRVACIGATVGRYAGRIAGGRFTIGNTSYRLSRNQDGNHLHGGFNGFSVQVWEGHEFENETDAGVVFRLISPDGDEGYPGRLETAVTFTVTQDDALRITYQAVSTKSTIVNLTNHCYFNLNGYRVNEQGLHEFNGNNSDIELMIDADRVVDLIDQLPTGRLLTVANTPFDFRTPKPIARDMPLLPTTAAEGYDHCFVLNRHAPDQPSVTAYSRRTGITLTCVTDRPGVQLFTMDNPGDAFAIETQLFPDSPNHPGFPNAVLNAGEPFSSETVYRFSRRDNV